ncbi:hypothetical protein [Flagellimonas sp.]|uniref:hypothetical protein n=1 Tax=Flagellimonas sp. TaxID=2058762 RepID=UPI003F4A5987
MIKFFRKIRQKLLSENKFSQYLVYAVGEIILVVIGILIAIKINAYNTQQDDIATIKSQLENVALELESNIALLEETIKKSEGIINSSKALATIISLQEEVSSQRLSEIIGESFAPVLNYQPSTVLLNEMILSGSLVNLKNKPLKAMLLEFQSKQASLKNQELLHAEDQQACTEEFLEHGDFKAVIDDVEESKIYYGLPDSVNRVGNQALLTSKVYENKVLLFLASAIGLENSEYEPFLAYMQNMLDTIENELKTYD